MFEINLDQDFEKQFETIAKDLFFNYELVVNNSVYDFSELEFYVDHKQKHCDPFVHKDEMQIRNGQWYFHGSGIDITIGNKENLVYGGILIRGIKNLDKESKEYISGPLLVAKEIFRNFGDIKYSNLMMGIRKKMISDNIETTEFIASTRINLPKRDDPKNYKEKRYRFLTYLNSKHPFKEKEIVAKLLKTTNQRSVEEINDLFGYKIIK